MNPINLPALVHNLEYAKVKQLEEILEIANIAWSSGNKPQAKLIFKREKEKSTGNLKKIYAVLQKSNQLDAVFATNFREMKKIYPENEVLT